MALQRLWLLLLSFILLLGFNMRDTTEKFFCKHDLAKLSHAELASLKLRCEDFSTTQPRLGEPASHHSNRKFINAENHKSIVEVMNEMKVSEKVAVSANHQTYADKIGELQSLIHAGNVNAGWWDEVLQLQENPPLGMPKSLVDSFVMNVVAGKIALMHSELSEALEGFRKGLNDDHLPHRRMIEVEFADSIIRILDTAEFLGLDVGGAIMEKLAYNAQRADHKRENRVLAGGKKI